MRPARTRFAPSPTGELHIGNARTALFNWLFARHFGGSFILRIEDTDTARSEAIHESSIMDELRWLGLSWDEGPDTVGPHGPYRQSERGELYLEHAERLVEGGLAYRCFCTKERLEELKAEQVRKGVPPRYDNRCRGLYTGGGEPPTDAPPVLRFAVPGGPVEFVDGVHGQLSFDTSVMGDFVIVGSDYIPSYNFAVVIDDAMMEITDVIRGDDHLSNTPRQLMLYRALGFTAPGYHHLPLVLSPEKTPLSKRDASSSVRAVREGGALPEAVINTIARLGWSPGAEAALTLDEMAAAFDGKKLSRSPSVFDLDRLNAYNKVAISKMDASALLSLASMEPTALALDAIDAAKASAATIAELKELVAPFIGKVPVPDDKAAEALSTEGAKAVLSALKKAVQSAAKLDEEAYKGIMAEVKSASGAKGRGLFMPVRAALTGRTEGIELVNVFRLLGRDEVIERLERCIGQ